MVCQVCHRIAKGVVCSACRRLLTPASERVLPGGVRVVAAFEHAGAAKRLIHNLKYRGVGGYPELVAEAIGSRLPSMPLVPVPRAWSRQLQYGVDPAVVLAKTLGGRLDLPVWELLRPAMHTIRRAGGDHSRPVAEFRTRSVENPTMVILVDDVVTTGATVLAATRSLVPLTVGLVVAANVVSKPSTLQHSQWHHTNPQS